MGRESDVVQGYLDKKEHFADLFNGCYFEGRQVVLPNELEEGSEVYNQEYLKKDYQSFAAEEQGKIKKKNAAPRTRDLKKRLKSGLTERDRLVPAFTTCLYLGTEPWTGPKNLKEMMDFGEDEEDWKELFADYKMNLICVNEMTDFSMFHTELKMLLMLLAYREDEEKMEKEIMNSPEFANLDRETAYVASVLLGNELLMEMCEEEEGDTVDMCGALKTWGEKKTAEGRAEGRAEAVVSLVKGGLLKLEEAAAFLNLSIEDMQRNISQE